MIPEHMQNFVKLSCGRPSKKKPSAEDKPPKIANVFKLAFWMMVNTIKEDNNCKAVAPIRYVQDTETL